MYTTYLDFSTNPNYLYMQYTQFFVEFTQFCIFNIFKVFNFSINPDNLYISCIQFSVEFTQFCTFNVSIVFKFFNKSRLSVYLIYIIFHSIYTILYNQGIQIFQQIQTICTPNVHNFSLNLHNSLHFSVSNEFKFFHKSRQSVYLMYTIFH